MEVDSSASGSSESSLEDRKKRKMSKSKHKKHKSKDKKQKKKSKHRRRHSSTSFEVSSSESDTEQLWVEATKKVDPEIPKKVTKQLKQEPNQKPPMVRPKEDDDEWSGFGNALPTYSNDSKRSKRQKEREEERLLSSIDKAGQHDRELNPYWKDGGRGLPVEEAAIQPKPVSSVGDGGLAWLKKSFDNAKQQAKESGRSVEDVVSERWGSLEAFYALLEEAENKGKGLDSKRERDDHDRRHKSFKRPSRYSDSDDDRRPSETRYSKSSSSSSRHQHHHRERSWRKDISKSPPRESKSWRKPGFESKKTAFVTKGEVADTKAEIKLHLSTSSKDVQRHVDDTRIKMKGSSDAEDSSNDDNNEKAETQEPKVHVLTDKEMNELNAKVFKAEMLGNQELVETLKAQVLEAEKARQEFIKDGKFNPDKPTKVITKVIVGSQGGRRTKDKPTESHREGQRIRYFPDDDKHTLKSMFEKEKMNTVEDENALFARLVAKGSKATEDHDMDDIFVEKASSSRQELKERKREVQNVMDEEKTYKKVLDDCPWCFDGSHMQKNLIISIGESCFMCVPPYQSLTEGHCLIVPMNHITCATQLDEDVWAEMQKFRMALVRMFRESDQDVVFFESALFLKKQPHMYLECVPMPKETGELAPIYFKKAIQECETEWSQNKKLVDLRDRDVRRAIPKGLPYFSVEFADDNCGFAHVIEDERYFPKNFAQEIIGGMLELDHQLWRKQKKDDFNTQRTKLMDFLKAWAPFDWTRDETNAR